MQATGIIVIWAASGPIFGIPDTWRLVIHTGTTIVICLMVVFIWTTQNRDAAGVDGKLVELIRAREDAGDRVANDEFIIERK